MVEVPAARFEDTATQQGSQEIVRGVGDFIAAYGVDAADRDQIAQTLTAVLATAAGHASPCARIAVTADVMPFDVQVVLSLIAETPSAPPEGVGALGGLELWISFPRGSVQWAQPGNGRCW